jgi:hypothetical protein
MKKIWLIDFLFQEFAKNDDFFVRQKFASYLNYSFLSDEMIAPKLANNNYDDCFLYLAKQKIFEINWSIETFFCSKNNKEFLNQLIFDYKIFKFDEKLSETIIESKDFELVKRLDSVFPCKNWSNNSLAIACKFAHKDRRIAQWLKDQNIPSFWNAYCCRKAIFPGKLETLQWLRSFNPPCPIDIYCFCDIIIFKRDLEILNWLYLQEPQFLLTKELFIEAIEIKNFSILNWLKEQNVPFIDVSLEVSDDIEVLEWIKKNYPTYPFCDRMVEKYIRNNNFSAIEWLMKNKLDFIWPKGALKHATKISTVKKLLSNTFSCPWSEGIYFKFISENHSSIDDFEELVQLKPPTKTKIFSKIIKSYLNVDYLNVLDKYYPEMTRKTHSNTFIFIAANFCQTEILDWYENINIFIPSSCIEELVIEDNSISINSLRKRNHTDHWDENICHMAALKGNYEMLRYLRTRKNSFPWAQCCIDLLREKISHDDLKSEQFEDWLKKQSLPDKKSHSLSENVKRHCFFLEIKQSVDSSLKNGNKFISQLTS